MMLEVLKDVDQHVFLFLNGLHCALLDPVFYYGTQTVTWFPLYALLFFLVIRQYRWRAVWVILLAFLMVSVSDQLSNVVKEMVARPRPTYEPGIAGVHTVNGYLGGQYGFYSAHASTNLALAVFMIVVMGRPFPYFSTIMIFYAVFMSYTRIYLGVHYPGDILAGWIAGGLFGWGFGQIAGWLGKPHGQKSEVASQ
jgi:undecaprenyl-diphosphatase